jgi:hypothetical protein
LSFSSVDNREEFADVVVVVLDPPAVVVGVPVEPATVVVGAAVVPGAAVVLVEGDEELLHAAASTPAATRATHPVTARRAPESFVFRFMTAPPPIRPTSAADGTVPRRHCRGTSNPEKKLPRDPSSRVKP